MLYLYISVYIQGAGLHLAVLVRMSAPQLVQMKQVRGRDDDGVELAQIAALVIAESRFAVVVNCRLTPHTPAHTHTSCTFYSAFLSALRGTVTHVNPELSSFCACE